MKLHALKIVLLLGVGLRTVSAVKLASGLMDPAGQPMFEEPCPNALDPDFIFDTSDNEITVEGCENMHHETGLVDPDDGETRLTTPVWGYADHYDGICTWPGRTFEQQTGVSVKVTWLNGITDPFLLTGRQGTDFDYSDRSIIDTSLHWAYSLKDCTIDGEVTDCGGEQTLISEGIPMVTHLHGGFSDSDFDGEPEFFFGPGNPPNLRGPRYVTNEYIYEDDQPAGNLWYHDHSLGVTRLNVYAGMAGFYFLRDDEDTGDYDNSFGLPAYPYEMALAIQDRMFKDNGELFYPAFPGDPFYEDFIEGEGADLSSFEDGGPTALAEFFGDFMVVNGKIWPKMDVEPRKYRLRLLNGCDSRFLVLLFCNAGPVEDGPKKCSSRRFLPFQVVGSDDGLGTGDATSKRRGNLIVEPGGRYDVVFDFSCVEEGHRVIMMNFGCDSPFGGDFGSMCEEEDLFEDRRTDRIMAFDVVKHFDTHRPERKLESIDRRSDIGTPTRIRRVALFEGTDNFGRLQPLLGTAVPATDEYFDPICWPESQPYVDAGLSDGDPATCEQISGTIAWHSPTTERVCLGDTEEWQIWNVSADAHPIHLHLVNFEIMTRHEIIWDSATDPELEEFVLDDDDDADGDGTYLVEQPILQHSGDIGVGYRMGNPSYNGSPEDDRKRGYFEEAPKDMVTALPGQVTKIKATFEKVGRYVWHCHILSHEDHEMMRVFDVVDCSY